MGRVLLGWPLLLGGCIDVPALDFQALPDVQVTPDAIGSRTDGGGGSVGRVDAAPPPADARSADLDRGLAPGDAAAGDAAVAVLDARPSGDAVLPPTPDTFAPPAPDAFTPPRADAAAPPPDATLPPTPDAAGPPTPDAARPDAALPDAARPDAALPDASLPDAALPDLALPDAALPDAALPDAAPPLPPPVATPVPGPATGQRFGAALAVVPDQNRNGFQDVVVGAPWANAGGGDNEESRVYLFDGLTGQELARHIERDDLESFGAALVAADFLADGRTQVIVGAGNANANRGALIAFSLPGLDHLDTENGQDQSGHMGQALALGHGLDGGAAALTSSPSAAAFSPRVYFYGLNEGLPGSIGFVRRARVNAVLVAPVNFGTTLHWAPATIPDAREDFIAVGDAFQNARRRVLRFQNGDPAPLRTEYVPAVADMTTGTSLLVLPTDPPQLAVGTPGEAAGVVSVFTRDGGEVAAPLRAFGPQGQAVAFGTSMVLAPHLLGAAAAAPGGLCVGAPGAGDVPGRVECAAIADASGLLALTADARGTGFGRALATGTGLDADGTWLLVVGAPDTSRQGGVVGGVVLYRVTPPR